MKATALLAVIQLMLVGVLALLSGACVRFMEMKWRGGLHPPLPEKITSHWPWLMAISLGWFAYALTAERRLQDRRWRHWLPLSLGLIFVAFVFILLIGVANVTFWSSEQTLSTESR